VGDEIKSFWKRLPVEDKALKDEISNQPCMVCKCPPPNDCDHLTSRGAGGGDVRSNLWALCRKMHTERHMIGLKSFVKKYNLPVTFEYGYPRRTDV